MTATVPTPVFRLRSVVRTSLGTAAGLDPHAIMLPRAFGRRDFGFAEVGAVVPKHAFLVADNIERCIEQKPEGFAVGVNLYFPNGFEWNPGYERLVRLADFVTVDDTDFSVLSRVRDVVPQCTGLFLGAGAVPGSENRFSSVAHEHMMDGVVARGSVCSIEEYRRLFPGLTVVAGGGAVSLEDALHRLHEGADAVQVKSWDKLRPE